ncbi:MAG: hypothetical protein GX882_01950 [Methanomicrobiales archaeon]|nr:hypothetical protein [Methanomicrobiales archaeon]
MIMESAVTNRDVAERLALMGSLLEVAGEDRHRAYARLSIAVAGLDREALTRIPGIGVSIAGQIREIVKAGSFRELEDMQAAIPGSVVELLEIPGVGPRTPHVFWKQPGILTIDDLERAVGGDQALPREGGRYGPPGG